jgi:hypothetical protein
MKKHLLLATLVALPFAAFAADEAAPAKPKRDPGALFKRLDTDGDGAINYEEFKAAMAGSIGPDRMEGVFKKKDADGNGKLTLPEFLFIPPSDAPKPAAAATKEGKKGKDKAKAKESETKEAEAKPKE